MKPVHTFCAALDRRWAGGSEVVLGPTGVWWVALGTRRSGQGSLSCSVSFSSDAAGRPSFRSHVVKLSVRQVGPVRSEGSRTRSSHHLPDLPTGVWNQNLSHAVDGAVWRWRHLWSDTALG